MWVDLIVAALVVIGVAGAMFGGGIFTIVLIPLAAIVFAASVLFSLFGRAAHAKSGGATDQTDLSDRSLPHTPQRPTGRVPTSPERLSDARRAQQ